MATIPPIPLRFAGTWNNTRNYNYADLVVSPINTLAYAVGNASRADVVGGPDPSVQPSANWVLIPDPNGGGGGGVNQLIAGANVVLTPPTGLGTVVIDATGVSAFVDSLQLYVAPNGSDVTGTGSQQNPFGTISKALDVRKLTLSTAGEVSIIVSSGTYTENLTYQRNTYVVGVQTGESRQPVNVVGNISMNDTAGSMGISGLEVNGNVATLGAGGNYTIFGCNISRSGGTAITATSGTVFITECRISNTSGSTIISSCSLTIRDCVVSTSGTGSVIASSTNLTLRQSAITSTSASPTTAAVIRFFNTSPISIIEMSYCRIENSTGFPDTGGNKCCIQYDGAGSTSSLVFSCLLNCDGAITGTGGQIQCVQHTGAGICKFTYGQLIAFAPASHIAPTTLKTLLATVT